LGSSIDMSHMGKYFRRAALSLMLLLTVAANCFCESYDDDPYDDTPPITFEFHFVKPQTVVHHDMRLQVEKAGANLTGTPMALFDGSFFQFVVVSVVPDQVQSATPLFSPLRT
jgi:hypothetical protein